MLKGVAFSAVAFAAYVVGSGAAAALEGRRFIQGLATALDNSWTAWAAVILIFLLGAALITCVESKRSVQARNRQ